MIFTRELFDVFRATYRQALADGFDKFLFEGQEFDIGYAKYLIEYLSNKWGLNVLD